MEFEDCLFPKMSLFGNYATQTPLVNLHLKNGRTRYSMFKLRLLVLCQNTLKYHPLIDGFMASSAKLGQPTRDIVHSSIPQFPETAA